MSINKTLAIYVLDGTGLERVDRGVPNYERELFDKGLSRGLGNTYDRVELALEDDNAYKYELNIVVLYVAHVPAAREDFIHLTKIVGRTPADFVYAVSTCEGLHTVHQSYEGALASLDHVKHECNAGIALIELEA